MSLEATHIRFANDIKNRYKIDDFSAYISGSIYPDSRYVTEIDRALTHGERNISKSLASTSFKIGWQSHYLCDIVFNKAKKIIFKEIVFEPDYTDDDWITSTAIKILQDIDDAKYLKKEDLDCLDYVETPNNEDISLLTKYNKHLKDLYKNNPNLKIDDYKDPWFFHGVEHSLVDLLITKTKQLSLDEEFVAKTKLMYKQMLDLS